MRFLVYHRVYRRVCSYDRDIIDASGFYFLRNIPHLKFVNRGNGLPIDS